MLLVKMMGCDRVELVLGGGGGWRIICELFLVNSAFLVGWQFPGWQMAS